MIIQNEEVLADRARDLEDRGFNGLAMALVTLAPQPGPTHALLELHFHNSLFLNEIRDHLDANPDDFVNVFPISGGHRIKGGPLKGQIRVDDAQHPQDDNILFLRVQPIGDYSTYTLSLNWQNIDPLFSEIGFKFRPGCFNLCKPAWDPPKPAPAVQPIDYLAKDYETFKHTMINAVSARVPGWRPTSEADLDQVLLELFAAGADEISDYQDRVVSEAYLGSARKRVSLARHARLMDYHIHQGHQATTWLALHLSENEAFSPDGNFAVDVQDDPRTRFLDNEPEAPLFGVALVHGPELDAAFISPALQDRFDSLGYALSGNLELDVREAARRWILTDRDNHRIYLLRFENDRIAVFRPARHALLNALELYDWDGTVLALGAGAFGADLAAPDGTEENARLIANLLMEGGLILLQEHLNPRTGLPAGRDPNKRAILRLTDAEAQNDPVAAQWFVRIAWRREDQLREDYCFYHGNGEDRARVALFHGNLIRVAHGQPFSFIFRPPGQNLQLALNPGDPVEAHYRQNEDGSVICALPEPNLAFRQSEPGGQTPPRSSLRVLVAFGGGTDVWDEVIDLVHSDDSSENGDHFQVEVDEHNRAIIRFGNGVNGRQLPDDAVVFADCQIGRGPDGNLGSDVLTHFDADRYPWLAASWNPFDIVNGLTPETRDSIIRGAPQAWKTHQLRAVTLQDYRDRAESLPDVSRAAASYRWTGSWRTVRIAIDPVGTTELTPEFSTRIARHLDAVRLIGDDLEIRRPVFVALDIKISLCIDPNYWPEDVRDLLEQAFSEGYNAQGQPAFFHPDRWSFGQTLRRSLILGAIARIAGVAHVNKIAIKRRDGRGGLAETPPIDAHEIIRVANDPDHLERGSIRFTLEGGRQ